MLGAGFRLPDVAPQNGPYPIALAMMIRIYPAADYVKALIANGVLAKETHERTIRFAPPITISYEEIDEALEGIREALTR